jgi:hypothetical protein
MTDPQRRVCCAIHELFQACNWRRLAAMEPEARKVVSELRAARHGPYKAIELHEQDRVIAEEVGNRAGQGRACINLGICYDSLGQYEKATTLHEQSIMICEELGDPEALMQACRGLRESLTRLGYYA